MQLTGEIAATAGAGVNEFVRDRLQGHSRKAVLMAISDPVLAAILLFNLPHRFATAPVSSDLSLHESHGTLHRLRPGLIITDGAPGSNLSIAAAAAGVPVAHASLEPSRDAPRLELELAAASFDGSPGRDYPTGTALILQTSGTTGAPKIVGLSRSNLRASTANTIAHLQLEETDRTLLVMPLTHIHGIVAVLHASLASGGALLALPPRDPLAFWNSYPEAGATWFSTVPSFLHAICETRPSAISGRSSTLKFIRTASSPLSQALRNTAGDLFEVPILEAYGMTEACHQVASNTLRENRPGSVGKPAKWPQIAIRTGRGAPVHAGESGEICIKGPNVFADYINSSDEAPRGRWRRIFGRRKSTTHWGRWFRTGDLGRLDDDGYLWINGRIKEQINRGGETLSPVEIEEALLSLPTVREAVVFPLPHPNLGEEVAAVCVVSGGTETVISAQLARLLSFNKLPKKIFLEASIPKASSGKVSRAALAKSYRERDPFGAGNVRQDTVAGPGSAVPDRHPSLAPAARGTAATQSTKAVVRRLDEIFRVTLGVRRVGRTTSFFELGGTSLKALQVMSAIRREFGLGLPISTIVTRPTVAELAGLIVQELSQPGAAVDTNAVLADAPKAARMPLPASLVDFCLADAIGARDDLRQMFVVQLGPAISVSHVERVLGDMIAAHPALRAAVVRQTDGLLLSLSDDCSVTLPVFDEVVDRWSDSLALLDFFRQPIALDRAPLMRAAAQALREGGYVVAFQLPELVLDGYARTAFLLELATRVAGKATARTDHFVEISRRMPLRAAKTDLGEIFRIPPDLNEEKGTSTGVVTKAIEGGAWKKINRLAAKWGVTPYAVQLTIFASVLERVAGGRVPVTVSLQCRRSAEEFFSLGNFSTRAQFYLSSDASDRISKAVRETASTLLSLLEAPPHQPTAFNDDLVMFDYEDETETIGNFLGSERMAAFARLADLRVEFIEPRAHSLSLGMKVTPPSGDARNGRIALAYDAGRFSSGRATAIVDAFLNALLSLETETDGALASLPLVPAGRLLAQATAIGNSVETFDTTMVRLDELFAESVRKWRDRPALTFPGGGLTFAELHTSASDLSTKLRRLGAVAGTAVAFWEGNPGSPSGQGDARTRCYPVAALGILISGAAVLPIGHQVPLQSAGAMLDETAAAVMVAVSSTLPVQLASRFRLADSIDTPAGTLHLFYRPIGSEASKAPETLREAAYVMFTSGATGAPKGIIQSHSSLVDLVRAAAATKVWPDGNALPGPNIGFDVFTGVNWITWFLGGAVHFRDEYEITSAAFAELLRAGVKSFITSPTAVGAILDQDETSLQGFDLVVLTGEALPHATAKRLLRTASRTRFVNFYGPTETTVWATWDALTDRIGPNVAIGRALGGYTIEVCEPSSLTPLPRNLPGEILIALQRGMVGYLDARLNRGRFVERPDGNGETKRFYRSGDIGWLGDDGKFYYLGRKDRQVQVAGVRVELGGVEEVIAALPAVNQVAVVDVPSPSGAYLSAFVVPAARYQDSQHLRSVIGQTCQMSLPRSAWPATVQLVAELPRTAAGKVAHRELQRLASIEHNGTGVRTPPRPGTVEDAVASLWKSLLGRNEVFLEDDFKSLGGTSLGVLLLSGALLDKFGVKIRVSELFFNSVLSAQINLVQERLDTRTLSTPPTGTELPATPLPYLRGFSRRPGPDALVRIVEPARGSATAGDIPVFVGIPAGGGWTGAGVHLSRALNFDHVVKIVEYTEAGHRSYDDRDWLGIAVAIVAELSEIDPARLCLVGTSLGGWLAWLVERTWVAQTGNPGPRLINIDGGVLHTLNRWEVEQLATSDSFNSILSRANKTSNFDMLLLQRDFGPSIPFVDRLTWDDQGGRVATAPAARTLIHGEMPIETAAPFAPYVASWLEGDRGATWPTHLELQNDSVGQKLYRAFAEPVDRHSVAYEDLREIVLRNAQYDQASEMFEMLALLAGDTRAYVELARRHYLGWPDSRLAVAKNMALSGNRTARSLNANWMRRHAGDDVLAEIGEILKNGRRNQPDPRELIGGLRNDLPSWLTAFTFGGKQRAWA